MMDRNAIKDNGILEQYLLGELSDEQIIEVENLLKEDQELREYFQTIEDDLEKLAQENAITPPTNIKKAILNSVKITSATHDKKLTRSSTRRTNPLYLSIAASLALFFMLSSGWLYRQLQESKTAIDIVQNEASDLRNRIDTLEKGLNETNTWYQAINNPNTIQLVLKGNQISPKSNAITYINHKTKSVIVNPQGLAKLDQDHTYQMWADVDGEMIDMGIIADTKKMIAMKYISNAASINITIEPAGGNDHPTVERLISNVLL